MARLKQALREPTARSLIHHGGIVTGGASTAGRALAGHVRAKIRCDMGATIRRPGGVAYAVERR
jgi:hypothetical protein